MLLLCSSPLWWCLECSRLLFSGAQIRSSRRRSSNWAPQNSSLPVATPRPEEACSKWWYIKNASLIERQTSHDCSHQVWCNSPAEFTNLFFNMPSLWPSLFLASQSIFLFFWSLPQNEARWSSARLPLLTSGTTPAATKTMKWASAPWAPKTDNYG